MDKNLKMTVATPCLMDWEEMAGDDRVRFCLHCSKNVYNISGYSTDEVKSLIEKHEGKLCVQIYQRQDGTVLTRDCPALRSSSHLRLVVAATVVVVAIMSGLGVLMAGQGRSLDLVSLRARVEYEVEEFTWKVKEMCGVKRPVRFLKGEMVLSPASGSGSGSSSTP